jgi:hypothetical protein
MKNLFASPAIAPAPMLFMKKGKILHARIAEITLLLVQFGVQIVI